MHDDGYQLPTVGDTVATDYQVPRHLGFAPEVIHPRSLHLLPDTEHPVTYPLEWTEQAACIGDWDLFDDPDPETYRREVRPRCAACPVWTVCLAEALEEEAGRNSKARTGIRGGLRPTDRARHQARRPPAVCCHGHTMGRDGSYFVPQNNHWVCRECVRLRKLARKQQQRALAG